MKHIITKIVILLIMLLSIGGNSVLAQDYDGVILKSVNGADLNNVINHILGKTEISDSFMFSAYDMDDNEVLNGVDLNILIYIALGKHSDEREMKRTRIFNIGDTEFKMIKVKGGTMDMGLRGEQTVGDFWIMETEMTLKLVHAIQKENSSLPTLDRWHYSYYYEKNWSRPFDIVSKVNPSGHLYDSLNKDYWPCNFRTPIDIIAYMTTISNLVGCDFRLPTVEEWIYAARGGKQSRGFKYAGSDNIDEIAWYSKNLNYNDSVIWHIFSYISLNNVFNDEYGYASLFDYFPNRIHCTNVKQKKPNELGLYDMSGNVAEVAVIDRSPYTFENGRYLVLGGSVRSEEQECIPGEAYEPEQCSLQYKFNPDKGKPVFDTWYDEYVYPYPVADTGLQEYLAVGARLVMDAAPEPSASPVVTVEPNTVRRGNATAIKCPPAITESETPTQPLNTEYVQP